VHVLRDGLRMLVALPRTSRHLCQVTASPAGASVTDEVFKGENAGGLGEADMSHWWFRSKARFVSTALQRYSTQAGWLLDVGGGAGGVTAQIGWEPKKTLIVEGNKMLARLAASRYALTAVNAHVADLPVADGGASVVCFLDVLEHLAHPEEALMEAYRVLAPGGCVLVTVPAHPRLWSAADEHLGHKRRYTRALARAQLAEQGFNVQYVSHIFSWLFLPVWVARCTRPGSGPKLGLDVMSPAIDRIAALLTRIEEVIVGPLRLPFGTSILCVAERP
jgi:SAM-dependent methyltransferase